MSSAPANPAPSDFADRLGETFRRAMPKLAPEARDQIAALIDPASLKIVAGVLVVWVASHAVGIGEIVDVIVGAVGVFSIGMAIFSGLDHLWEFATGTYKGRTSRDLDKAADHLAEAIAILGIQAVLAALFKGRPRTNTGPKLSPGSPPPGNSGWRYKPSTKGTMSEPAGAGSTSFWGDIQYSLRGSANDQALVLLHERVHQFLAPKLYPLRRFRVQMRVHSYAKSSLARYLEEAVAETVAQVGVNGMKQVLVGLKFPVANGYVRLRSGGGYSPWMGGKGVLPETGALLGTGSAAGITFQIWFEAKPRTSTQGPDPR